MEIETLIAGRLKDMAAQVEILCNEGNFAEAELLREEGLMLADCYDGEGVFMYLPDFRYV
jgi:hypothetical protein